MTELIIHAYSKHGNVVPSGTNCRRCVSEFTSKLLIFVRGAINHTVPGFMVYCVVSTNVENVEDPSFTLSDTRWTAQFPTEILPWAEVTNIYQVEILLFQGPSFIDHEKADLIDYARHGDGVMDPFPPSSMVSDPSLFVGGDLVLPVKSMVGTNAEDINTAWF
jgi:hypothetical protein